MKKKYIILLIVLGLVILILVLAYLFRDKLTKYFFNPTPVGDKTEVVQDQIQETKVVAENLQIPWEITFLSDGEMLVTERPGNLLKIGTDKKIIPIERVEHVGEGGLLGMVLHPDFENNQWIYLYLTTKSGNGLVNRVERYRLENSQLSDKKVVIENIPGASNHDGGRIAFGHDGYLYITTGDAQNSDNAQNLNSLAGKILRLKDDGSIPEDNPFGSAVYSYGHRNPQGLAWDSQGRLWATEHGRSGVQSGYDELNLIIKGGNYGWPIIQGDEEKFGMITPVINSGPDETWAPAGLAYYNDRLFFGGLRGQSLYEAKINKEGKVESLKAHFKNLYGRIRAVVLGPNDNLYISTSNTDGRGTVQSGDDKIIRTDPDSLIN